MTYLVLQMIGAMLISAAFGAGLLWLGQVFWGRLVAPVRAKTLEDELEESDVAEHDNEPEPEESDEDEDTDDSAGDDESAEDGHDDRRED